MNDEVNKIEASAKKEALDLVNKEKTWIENNAKPLLIGAGVVIALIVGYLILR